MVRKASTRKRQTEVAGKKKLVAGVDFSPPEPSLPPSLSGIRGGGHFQMEEEETLRQLEQAIHDLPLKEGGKDSSATDARDLLTEYQDIRVALRLRRKSGTASTLKVQRELKEIARRSSALLKLLKKADRNTFEAWMDAACADGAEREAAKQEWLQPGKLLEAARSEGLEREAAKQEWLQLGKLLEASAERATRAAQAAQCVEKNRAAGGKSGRPPHELADHIVVVAANIYERRTGITAYREISRNSGKPRGAFHDFLTRVFQALDLESSADACNMRLQAKLREMEKSGSAR
jgi:hypothetical protein